MELIEVLKKPEMRRIFGERELVIIDKQLRGVNLLPSERTRLSRDIRKKLVAVQLLSAFIDDFKLKKGLYLKEIIDNAKETIMHDALSSRIKKILLFGTAAENRLRLGSDIDIAVYFNKINKDEAFAFERRLSGEFGEKIDIKVYNTLPLNIQHEIDKRGKILFEKKN